MCDIFGLLNTSGRFFGRIRTAGVNSGAIFLYGGVFVKLKNCDAFSVISNHKVTHVPVHNAENGLATILDALGSCINIIFLLLRTR
jgi:hypothetical protein